MTDTQYRDAMLDEARLIHLAAHAMDLNRNADFLERQAQAFKAEAEQNRKMAAQLYRGIERYRELLG